MKKSLISCLVVFLFFTISYSQSKIRVTVNYPDAEIFKVVGGEVLKPSLGFGSILLKLSKKSLNKIKIVKEGFEPVIQQYPRTVRWPKQVQVNLENRVIQITSQPFDAEIYVEGNNVGTKNYELVLLKDAIITVELKKKGYKTVTKTYFNVDGKEEPPLKGALALKDKIIEIKVFPPESEIFVNQSSVGIGSATVTIPENDCVLLEVKKDGFVGREKVFCNKENDTKPPYTYKFTLTDRLVKISVSPDDAEIKVDGKIVGVGSYDLKVPENKCIQVLAIKKSFLTLKKNYCNSDDYQEPPTRDHLELREDEAIKNSISTDFANVNFTIAVRDGMTEVEAWKLLSSIVTTEFDVLEVIDRETGYLRTAWQVQSFNGESTIRTRVVVKLGDSNPLKYVMKISSERAEGVVSVKDDQEFEEWGRILKKYKNIIEEAQSRL